VVVTLWQDEFRKADSGKLVYVRGPIWEEASKKRLGHLELMENLRWAIDHCVGQVNVIVAIAKDTKAKPRSISECFPGKMRLRVTNLDEATGAFGFETIE
jgi:Uri superfamily endonuclease